ncbi:MAG: thiamine pyrophosphate-binding protein [Eubacteriales bacterium]|nr:thiamine pyrophosphate-binding protein [Eubacteriales bacterium]
MRIRVADYIAKRLVEYGIKQNFSVVGGGSMHLNDAIGHTKEINTIYNHHEQASAMAAEAYARINNRPALVTVTSGPGGTNTITGVAGAYLDSIPMLVLSGQVRLDNTKYYAGINTRAIGDQEIDIVEIVKSFTKYATMITKAEDIVIALEEALYICNSKRKGPCWIDIPVDIQGEILNTKQIDEILNDYYKGKKKIKYSSTEEKLNEEQYEEVHRLARLIIEVSRNAKRPIVYTGNAIRIANAHKEFKMLVKKMNMPVVVSWNGIDVIESDNLLFAGHPGMRGDRPGNLAVQNADIIISIGSRLSIRQVGYEPKKWAPKAFKIVNDIDEAELQKKTLKIDIPICANCKDLIDALLIELDAYEMKHLSEGGVGLKIKENNKTRKLSWIETCAYYRKRFPVVTKDHYDIKKEKVNPYAFMDYLSLKLPDDQITAVGNGTPCVIGAQMYNIKKNQRFISQSGMAAMGYDLPAAIGAYKASNKDIVLITGDGSMQMNIQELQTIVHHNMKIKIFYLNNNGYHSIRQTQKSFFNKRELVGIGKDSGLGGKNDLSFPDIKKIANAYGIDYYIIKSNKDLKKGIDKIITKEAPFICEVIIDEKQGFLPKVSSKRMPNGTLESSPLEDMAPFLKEKELKKLMFEDY